MADTRAPIAVISLVSAPDTGTWITDYLGDVALVAVTADEKKLDVDLDAAFASGPKRAWVALDHVLMGHLCKRIVEGLAARSIEVPRLVHPSAVVSSQARLGAGVLVSAGAVIGAGASIADHTRVHERAVVSRGARIGSFSAIDPGCIVGESATVGSFCWIRRGVILEARAQVGDHCEFHVPGAWGGTFPEGHVHFAGVDGPVRIHRFG